MTHVVVWVIRFYQRAVSPFIPHSCRFTPTCSAYFSEAVATHGFFRGSLLGFKRIMRCHPLHSGGYDPVKNLASEIVLIDINKEKVEGEVMDIRDGLSFSETQEVKIGDYKEAADADIIIFSIFKFYVFL